MTDQPVDPDETIVPVSELRELRRLLEQRTPVIWTTFVLVILVGLTLGIITKQTIDDGNSISVIARGQVQQQAANEESSREFNTFFGPFIAEQDYICTVLAVQAARENLPTPGPEVCAVSPPGRTKPSSSATPARACPSGAPTAAPVGSRPSSTAQAAPLPSQGATAAPSATARPTPTPTPTSFICLPVLCPTSIPLVAAHSCG